MSVFFASGCDREIDGAQRRGGDREGDPAATESPSRIAETLGVDAAAVTSPIDPAPPAGDLRAELDAFTTLDACVAQHAALDPLVGDAIRAIGYETFLRDACRVLSAAKQKEVRTCDAIDASGLRTRCQSVVAMVTANAEACPWTLPDVHSQGRDPTCVAVASRDPRLCAGETHAARSTCDALAARDETKCRSAKDDAEQSRCRREAIRWKRVIDPAASNAHALPKIDGKLAVHGVEGTAEPAQTESDLATELARGVVVRTDRSGKRASLEIGRARELGATVYAPAPMGRSRIAATIAIDAKGAAALDHFELDVPGASTLVYPGVRCACTVAVTKLERARGGEVKLAIDGVIGVAPHAYKIQIEASTFVRDVDDAAGAPAASPRSLR